jgi:hypothetical protein
MPFGNGSGDFKATHRYDSFDRKPLSNINAGTHKKVYYRIVNCDDDSTEARILQEIANLVLKYNGRVYGASPMNDTKVLISFEIPKQHTEQFQKEEHLIK